MIWQNVHLFHPIRLLRTCQSSVAPRSRVLPCPAFSLPYRQRNLCQGASRPADPRAPLSGMPILLGPPAWADAWYRPEAGLGVEARSTHVGWPEWPIWVLPSTGMGCCSTHGCRGPDNGGGAPVRSPKREQGSYGTAGDTSTASRCGWCTRGGYDARSDADATALEAAPAAPRRRRPGGGRLGSDSGDGRVPGPAGGQGSVHPPRHRLLPRLVPGAAAPRRLRARLDEDAGRRRGQPGLSFRAVTVRDDLDNGLPVRAPMQAVPMPWRRRSPLTRRTLAGGSSACPLW